MKWIKKWYYIGFILFFILNVIAANHAYKLTHFTEKTVSKTKSPKALTTLQKINTLLFGVNNPKPTNKTTPKFSYTSITLKSNKTIACWYASTDTAQGTVILFHGYSGSKSDLINRAEFFVNNGFNCLLVDFMGAGDSEGIQTTIGFKEAEQVKTCFNFIKNKNTLPIHLFGTSMGAVATMKAINDYHLKPTSIILECPFGSMLTTIKARFKLMGVPHFPMAHLLLFWGSIENNFWGFSHNPVEYAKAISCPVLLLHGASDPKVSAEEISTIYKNIPNEKQLIIYPNTGHENYLSKNSYKWKNDVLSFIRKTKKVVSTK